MDTMRMLVKNRSLLFGLIVILPVTIAFVSMDLFFVLTSILIIITSLRSLKHLCIINFGSNKTFEKMERKSRLQNADRNSIVSNRVNVFTLYLLFIAFFVYTYFNCCNLLLQVAAGITGINWIYDLMRTFKKQEVNGEDSNAWTAKDRLAEAFLWFHNLSTIAVIAFALFFRFFA